MTRCPLSKEQLAPIFDDVEMMEQRIEQLEQLCRDLWAWANYPHELTEGKALRDRMDALELLEVDA